MRKTLDDGQWFDTDKAECWQDNISDEDVTERERLYRTQSANWVLESWSSFADTETERTQVDDDAACKWLIKNDHYDAATKHVPDTVKELEL